MSFLSDADYRGFLEEHIRRLDNTLARDHVVKRFGGWRQQYQCYRLVERMAELLEAEKARPKMLYLRRRTDLDLLHLLVKRHHFDTQWFRGFLVGDDLWSHLQPEWFSPFPVSRVSEWQDPENTVVFTFSEDKPFRAGRDDRGNDYLERFIDLSRFANLTELRRRQADGRIVLYVEYRRVKTIEALAGAVSDRYTTVALVTDPEAKDCGCHHTVREPYFYLWPLVLKHLAPDVFHVNVGWGTQGLPFMPFVSDQRKAVVDFYDMLVFVPDSGFDPRHSEPRELTRASEDCLWTTYRHFIHRCSDRVMPDLHQKFPHADIASVIEYVKEPMYSEPSPNTDNVNLVYGGIIIQDASDRDSLFYRRFCSMVDFFAKDNLHVHVYPSPYLYGYGRPHAVEELIQTQGLTNVHACNAMEEDAWIRDIARHDYGICIVSDTRPSIYPHILPFKVISYLRAGLPVVVPDDQPLMVDLIQKYKMGVVYGDEDCSRMAELLNGQDVNALKENVVRFRSMLGIDKAGDKISAIYERIIAETQGEHKTTVQMKTPSAGAERTKPTDAFSSLMPLALTGRRYMSESDYTQFLEATISQADASVDKAYVRRRLQMWAQAYHAERMVQRAKELLAELKQRPFALYVENALSLHAAARLLTDVSAEMRAGFQGLVVEDEFLAKQDVRASCSCPICPRSQVRETHGVIVCLSGQVPSDGVGTCLANDYREKFIDLRRFDRVCAIRREYAEQDLVLYPLYREIQTVPIMAGFVRQKDANLRCVSLSPEPLLDGKFDASLIEPFAYLWPLVFRMMDADLVHLNVGWGIQALTQSLFLPDRKRTVIDFYEVLSFVPDEFFERSHSTAQEVRQAEKHLFQSYDHVMHLCSDETTTRLVEKYGAGGSIVSVTEYLQPPLYNAPPRNDGEIRLVYGGAMLAANSPDNFYYQPLLSVLPHYTRDNLRLYIYNSPYLDGTGENNGLKDFIRSHGFTNVHACRPLKLEDFVKTIAQYDYGTFLLMAKDMKAAGYYNYFMAYKFLAYLRAGLPIVIDAANVYLGGLVKRYNIGIAFEDEDLENLPQILNEADLPALKRNVIRFRDEFSIEKGGRKVLDMYHEILESSRKQRVFAVGHATEASKTASDEAEASNMIATMAEAENRLYYRDQSAQTIVSLARYAREVDPTVIVELGTLAGLSLRTWIASTERTKIYAVDLSFKRLHETKSLLPLDLARVTLVEQDILKTDFPSMWTANDRVIFFVDAHDLPGVPIMEYVLTTALPALPDGCLVVVDDLWFSEDRLTTENARSFLENRVRGEVDELQCFEGHYAPYHRGGSFMGFAEVRPLLAFVNRCGIELMHDKGSKHVRFVWKKEYAAHCTEPLAMTGSEWGCVLYNPLASVLVAPALRDTMARLAGDYRHRKLRDVVQTLSRLIAQNPQDQGVAYGLAVCLARVGMLSQARDILACHSSRFNHPRSKQLFDDLVAHVGPCQANPSEDVPQETSKPGLTLFALPKPFEGHTAIIQRNAIRSWARLDPKPQIILVGDESGVREMAAEVGAQHIPHIERTEFGTPLVNKLFESAEAQASHDIVAYVNADIVLFQDFVEGVRKVRTDLSSFLLIGQRWDLAVLDEIDFDRPDWQGILQRQMESHAMLHAECGLDYFVYPKGLYPEIPAFAIGRTAWDNWLVMTPHRLGVPVVDGTEFITAVHQDHAYGHVAGGRGEIWNGTEAMRNKALAGQADNSGRTSGATRVLRRDGTLIEVAPRQPWHLTILYRSHRSEWLLKQAEHVFAAGQMELAACKWNEALALLEVLLAFKQARRPQTESLDPVELAGRYQATCLRLAQCYVRIGRPDQAVETYTRLIENRCLQIPQTRRDDIQRKRDEAERLVLEGKGNAETPAVAACPNGEPVGFQMSSSDVSLDDAPSSHLPTLQAGMSLDMSNGDVSNRALTDLERKYRAMANGTRAKYALAVRLSDLFRRAGLREKSRALELEAAALKNTHRRSPPSPGTGQRRSVVAEAAGDPKVTIITACRNGEKWLPECLDSIQNQTMSQWQLFLLDDGSTDGTRRIIEEYAERDRRITPFYFDDNAGPYVRRNYLIARATTPFVMVHDADDIMCPEKVQRLYEAISADDRLGVVGSFYYNFLDEFEGTEHAEAMRLLTTHEQILEAYVTRRVCDFTSHGAAIVRRSLFDAIGFYDENPFGADSFWLAKVAEYAHHTGRVRVKNIPDFLTLRRLHSGSQTGLLPSIDPRGRRNKYWRYCVARLQEVVARVAENPELDLAHELRHCTCGDFIQRFLVQIVECEKQSVDAGVLSDCLEIARIRFRQQRYVTCIRMLRGVESMDPEAAQSIPNLDLLTALSLYGLGLKERARDCLCRALANREDALARRFHEEAFQSDAEIDVQQWYAEHAESLVLQKPDVAPVGRPVTRSAPSAAPKVTIVTACRNAERFLPECLDSILGQTLTDWELSLLDDGSTDGTRQIIKAYAEHDARIRPCYFDDQAGPYVRRNFAIQRARADFIVIQDADDIMCSTKLDILYGEISRDDTLGMVGGSFRTFLDTYHGPRYSEHNALPLTHDEIIARFKAWRHAMSHGAAIIRKSLFTEIGLYDENPFSSDSFWSAKLATYVEAGRPVRTKNVSECLTLIRMHANNHTKVLSTLDPRNRRNRYRLYCECKLLRIRERIQSLPNVDVAEELRRCTCSDFLTRFKAQIIAWEGEPLDKRVIPEYLESAVRFFNGGYYVSCVNILNNVESFEPTVVDRVMGYDLLRGMALHAVQLKECSRVCLDREIRRHDNAGARAFKRDVLDSPQTVEVWQWCNENSGRYNLGLVLSDNPVSSREVLCGDATAKPQGAL